PMFAESIMFKGHRCFKNDWAGFEAINPVNVIIGRNNTGKSHLLDLVQALCENSLAKRGWRCRCRTTLDEANLRRVFSDTMSGGELGGNFWNDHGLHFINKQVEWETDENCIPAQLFFGNGFSP